MGNREFMARCAVLRLRLEVMKLAIGDSQWFECLPTTKGMEIVLLAKSEGYRKEPSQPERWVKP